MTRAELQVLLELDSGEFHAFQCERSKHNKVRHAEMMAAFDSLRGRGIINLIGDEFFLGHDAQDVLAHVCRSYNL